MGTEAESCVSVSVGAGTFSFFPLETSVTSAIVSPISQGNLSVLSMKYPMCLVWGTASRGHLASMSATLGTEGPGRFPYMTCRRYLSLLTHSLPGGFDTDNDTTLQKELFVSTKPSQQSLRCPPQASCPEATQHPFPGTLAPSHCKSGKWES